MLQHSRMRSSAPCTQLWRDSPARPVPCRRQSRSSRRDTLIIPRAAAVASEAETQVSAVVHPVHPVLPAPREAHFVHDNTVFVEEFRIRGNEAGPDQRANIITIANLLQEVGGNHGVAMWGRSSTGFASMPGMDHLIFVATRMQIRMEAYPMWGDTVRLQTYFAEDGRLTTRRDWLLTDAATGRHLGAATSTWVTINTETRRPARLPEDVKSRFRSLAPSPPRFAVPADQTRQKLPEFIWPPQLTAPSQLGRRSDMDPNGHINNVAYLAWALEVIPEETYQGYQLTEVEMDFKAECTAGDQIECFGMPLTEACEGNGQKQQFLHLLRKGGSDAEVWRARTTWAPVSNSSSSNGVKAAKIPAAAPAASSNGIKAATIPAAAPAASSNGVKAATVPAAAPAASSNGIVRIVVNGVAASNGVKSSSSSSQNGASSASASSNGASAGTSSDSSGGLVGAALGAVVAFFGMGAGSDSDASKN